MPSALIIAASLAVKLLDMRQMEVCVCVLAEDTDDLWIFAEPLCLRLSVRDIRLPQSCFCSVSTLS